MKYDDIFFETTDIDWLSCDAEGNIAHFASGGNGYIPEVVKIHFDLFDKAMDYAFEIEDTSNVNIIYGNIPIKPDDAKFTSFVESFVELSSKGLYSYDVSEQSHSNSGYKLISTPERPINITQLSKEFQNILKRNIINQVIFSNDLLQVSSKNWS